MSQVFNRPRYTGVLSLLKPTVVEEDILNIFGQYPLNCRILTCCAEMSLVYLAFDHNSPLYPHQVNIVSMEQMVI